MTGPKGREVESGEVWTNHQEDFFHPKGVWALEQWSQHDPDRVQEVLGQCSQTHGGTLGDSAM